MILVHWTIRNNPFGLRLHPSGTHCDAFLSLSSWVMEKSLSTQTQAHIQTDRQTDRQTDTHTDRHTHRQTHRHTDSKPQTDRQTKHR